MQKMATGGIIDQLFNKELSVWAAKNEGYYLKCVSIIYQIFYELNSHLYITQDKLQRIKPALDYIDRHFTEHGITCELLAEKCEISYSYLKELFVEQYKISPNRYSAKMRINYACDLLRENKYTVTQVAALSGFSDVCYFCRCFKKSVGITPTQFMKKYISAK